MDLALFDFDGTITSRETMPDFVRAAVRPWRLRWGGAMLAPLVAGYRLGIVRGTTVRAAICHVGFRGMPVDEYRAQGLEFARRVLPSTLRPDVMRRIDAHRNRGDRVIVVSGGLDVYLGPWCAAHGLEVLCSALAERDGVLTGRYAGPQCVRGHKATRVRATCALDAFERIHAYGDTPEDRELLDLAHERWYRGERVPTAA